LRTTLDLPPPFDVEVVALRMCHRKYDHFSDSSETYHPHPLPQEYTLDLDLMNRASLEDVQIIRAAQNKVLSLGILQLPDEHPVVIDLAVQRELYLLLYAKKHHIAWLLLFQSHFTSL
jgi:hypothetical protein